MVDSTARIFLIGRSKAINFLYETFEIHPFLFLFEGQKETSLERVIIRV